MIEPSKTIYPPTWWDYTNLPEVKRWLRDWGLHNLADNLGGGL